MNVIFFIHSFTDPHHRRANKTCLRRNISKMKSGGIEMSFKNIFEEVYF